MTSAEAEQVVKKQLSKEGWTPGDINATITTVSWTEKTTTVDDNSAADIYDNTGCTIQQDENADTYTSPLRAAEPHPLLTLVSRKMITALIRELITASLSRSR